MGDFRRRDALHHFVPNSYNRSPSVEVNVALVHYSPRMYSVFELAGGLWVEEKTVVGDSPSGLIKPGRRAIWLLKPLSYLYGDTSYPY